jgi:hypothetical protein
MMNDITQLFMARRRIRARSYKPSTVKTREREMQREGLSAATQRSKRRWRTRRCRAKMEIKSWSLFRELDEVAPHLCKKFLTDIDDHFNKLRDKELRLIGLFWEVNKAHSVPAN